MKPTSFEGSAEVTKYVSNPELKTANGLENWKGTPLDVNGRFVNLDHPFSPDWIDLFKWQLQSNPFRTEKRSEIWKPEVFKNEDWLNNSDDIIVWLGHSTFYIRINGIKILTDPVFGDILSVKRRSEFPLNVAHLINLDYILLSHDHRDHLDKVSLKILAKQNPDVHYLTGLGMKKIVYQFTQSSRITEAGWYQQYETKHSNVNITFVPSRHWSKRGLRDTNSRLWGGFVIEASDKRILFGGDSGYDQHYKQMASVFGSFNYAILGIGAYEPAWFMSANHQSPQDAIKGFGELNARFLIPMHYGTFDLSDEPLGQPLKELHAAAAIRGLTENLRILQIGDPLAV